jgi:hypothetical protein
MGYHVDPFEKTQFHSKINRHIHGGRGARFASPKASLVVFISTFGFVGLLMRLDDPPLYRAPDPPVKAPFSPNAISFVVTAQAPHMKRLEVESTLPQHLPRKQCVKSSDSSVNPLSELSR